VERVAAKSIIEAALTPAHIELSSITSFC
jgi:hypothetical protein